MTITFAQAARQAELTTYSTQYGAAAQLAIFSGSMPATADAALSGNAILGALPFSATPFGAPTAAIPSVITANAFTQENAYTTGTATFFRTYSQGTSGAATAMVANSVYMINAVGNTVWTTYGAPNNNIGTVFVANGAGTGTGTCYPMSVVDQGAVATSASDLNMNTTAIVAGGPIAITSFTRQM